MKIIGLVLVVPGIIMTFFFLKPFEDDDHYEESLNEISSAEISEETSLTEVKETEEEKRIRLEELKNKVEEKPYMNIGVNEETSYLIKQMGDYDLHKDF